MKLRNKRTGEIIETCEIFENLHGKIRIRKNGTQSYAYEYNSLAKLNEEWEDYKVPKEYWYMDYTGRIRTINDANDEGDAARKEIGNYFETEEEAEKAVEKLKAWKRLKDDGLKIREYELNGGTDRNGCFTGDICLTLDISKPVYEDILQLLFGGEE